MPVKETPACAKCGRDIVPQPELGDRQGGLTHFKFGAETWTLWLCSDCKKPLYELYFPFVEMFLPEGTVTGGEKMDYLPRADEPGSGGPRPPEFKG